MSGTVILTMPASPADVLLYGTDAAKAAYVAAGYLPASALTADTSDEQQANPYATAVLPVLAIDDTEAAS